uniref:Uncharacterized protein n=1 Tax=Glossina austeni TaxID=7395 RepID=A0A1A9UDW2_GLOAU
MSPEKLCKKNTFISFVRKVKEASVCPECMKPLKVDPGTKKPSNMSPQKFCKKNTFITFVRKVKEASLFQEICVSCHASAKAPVFLTFSIAFYIQYTAVDIYIYQLLIIANIYWVKDMTTLL